MRFIFSEYYAASCAAFFGAGLAGFYYTTGGGGGASSSSTFFLVEGAGCSAGFSAFFMRAAEGGLFGLTYFFSYFTGSGSPFPKILLTNGSEDFPLVAHLCICCRKSLVAFIMVYILLAPDLQQFFEVWPQWFPPSLVRPVL
jgi:hypothetical protein